jgi:hypothetical protein
MRKKAMARTKLGSNAVQAYRSAGRGLRGWSECGADVDSIF